MYGRGTRFRALGLWFTAGFAAASFGACGADNGANTDDACVDDVDFFQENVLEPILMQSCATCHNDQGEARGTSFILRGSEWGPDYVEQNYEMFSQLSKLEYEGTPWILLKPTLQIEHAGGERFTVGSEEYKTFEAMIARIKAPTVCEDDGDLATEFFDQVELLDEVATLRKATLSLVGRLPTPEEEERVRVGGFEAVDVVLDEVMQQPEFLVRVKEIYNDHFLTDRYYPELFAIDLLNDEDYPNRYWFAETENEDEDGRTANQAVAREPLELVAHVVANERPFTEVLTADYTMVNPWSAKVFNVKPSFANQNDATEFVEARIPGVPHAGVLTSTVWLTRFPTTDTNRNRQRARMVYDLFLGTDVQALGSRPVDATQIEGFNPTMNDPTCTQCHAVVDPVAGAFQNWDAMGAYRPREEGWYPDMRPTGFGDAQMPFSETPFALKWLVQEVVNDRRFAMSAIRIVYQGLTGDEPLTEPSDPKAVGYLEGIKAAKVQKKLFDEIAQKFIDSNYNLKAVVKEVVKTPYYRAHNASEDLDEVRTLELAGLGTGRLLTPEQLNRKIVAATGYPWRNDVESPDYLTDLNQYRIFYGGIDSDTVVQRIAEPNGIMANVAKRMGNEMACLAVPQDFARPAADRFLFPLVERDFEPEDANGFEVPAAAAAIRANIRFLAQRLWGEYLDQNDPEINRAFALYVDVWKDGQAGLALPEEEGRYPGWLPGVCVADFDFWTGEPYPEERIVSQDDAYTVRAWMAVVTYMLSDNKFLIE